MTRINAWLLVIRHTVRHRLDDAGEVDLQRHRALQAPWTDWTHVAARGRHWAQVIARVVLEGNA